MGVPQDFDTGAGAAQVLIVEELDAFQSPAVHAGEPEHVGRQRAVGIEAVGFGHEFDSGNLQSLDRFGFLRGGLALDPHEWLAAGQPFFDLLRGSFENAGEFLRCRLGRLHLGRPHGDGGDVDADRHGMAPAIENCTALAHCFERILHLIGRLAGQPGSLVNLKQKSPAADRDKGRRKDHADQKDAETDVFGAHAHQGITIICLEVGRVSPSFSCAIRMMRCGDRRRASSTLRLACSSVRRCCSWVNAEISYPTRTHWTRTQV